MSDTMIRGIGSPIEVYQRMQGNLPRQPEWKLIHTFERPTNVRGQTLWRCDFDPNYEKTLFDLVEKHKTLGYELRGDIHDRQEFWAWVKVDG